MAKKRATFSKFYWLVPVIVCTTLLYGVIYLCIQQSYRMSANDPQIQMAEDIASHLTDGKNPLSDSLFTPTVDIKNSLAPYIIIYDEHGGVIRSSGLLHGQVPLLPYGVFPYVKVSGEDRFTWQPEVGVRSAAVVTRYSGGTSGYVLVARSLREVEKREGMLEIQIFVGWIVTILSTFIVSLLKSSHS